MNIDNIYNLFSYLHNDTLSFLYHGSFDDEITGRIIDISETNILSHNEELKISNKVSFLLAECFQNVVRHGGEINTIKERDNNAGVFITRNIGKSYFITSANLIENKDIPGLKQKLDQINNLSPIELKELYINVLSDNTFSNKGGAGLGLIEMARKSGHKLDFDFEEVDKDLSFFYLQIKLQGPEHKLDTETISLSVAKEFHHMMSIDNLFIIHKGDFSNHTVVPILRMIEDNIRQNQFEKNSIKKKIFHVLVEILQNVSRHAVEINDVKEGIFMMGHKDGHYIINTGNFIKKEKINDLTKHINTLNSFDHNLLVQLYKVTLQDGESAHLPFNGLGLIDIAREASAKLKYRFFDINDDTSFFALHVLL